MDGDTSTSAKVESNVEVDWSKAIVLRSETAGSQPAHVRTDLRVVDDGKNLWIIDPYGSSMDCGEQVFEPGVVINAPSLTPFDFLTIPDADMKARRKRDKKLCVIYARPSNVIVFSEGESFQTISYQDALDKYEQLDGSPFGLN